MKVLLINGSPHKKGCTYTALHEVETTLQQNGIETEMLHLGKAPVSGCIACMNCMTTGFCFQKDIVRDIQMRLDEFNGIVIGSPVYYSAPTGQLISFLNRLFFATEKRMAGKLEPLQPLSNSINISRFATCLLYHLNIGILYMASHLMMLTKTKKGYKP